VLDVAEGASRWNLKLPSREMTFKGKNEAARLIIPLGKTH
jgi:hypothetical protein